MPMCVTSSSQIVNDVTNEANASVAAKEAANRQNILNAGGTIRELDACSARHGSTR
jgi:hypothetical protein